MSPSTWSVVIAGIALIVSVLSPYLTARENNRHQRKMWETKHYEEAKSKAISDYLAGAGMMVYQHAAAAADSYGQAYGKIFTYAPQELWPLIIELDNSFHQMEYDEAGDIFIRVSTELAKALRGQAK